MLHLVSEELNGSITRREDLEEIEAPKMRVAGYDCTHLVFQHQGCDMTIVDKVPAGPACASGDLREGLHVVTRFLKQL